MSIPYRTRRALQRVGLTLLVLLLVAVLVASLWLVWVQRFVYYTSEGAGLDFSYVRDNLRGEVAVQPTERAPVSIYYNEGEDVITETTEMTQMVGYYVDAEALAEGLDGVRSQLQQLSAGTAVMVDVKGPKGEFYYSSAVAAWRSSAIDIAGMDQLISYMNERGLYVIARVSALRDYLYFDGNRNLADGIHHSSRQYLWADEDYCYWLDPAREGTVMYLMQIITELKKLGFDEVVLDNFYIPESGSVFYEGDRNQVLMETAKTLVDSCATEQFALSFVGTSAQFPLPAGRSRLYLTDVAAADAAATAQETGLESPDVNLVFLTQVHDTRFDAYSVLRPLAAAH